MKHKSCKNFRSLLLLTVLLVGNCLKALDSSKIAIPLYYRFSVGACVGKGYPLQVDDFGGSGLLEFAVQKKTNIYSLGARGVGELNIFDQSNVNNSVNSA